MECNRDEALRAKGIAEEKLASQDFVGAKKFAQRAQQLFPALDNISQMIAVIDVHLASQVKVGTGEKDWYRILQIDPTADDALVKKQYKKLALFLHPDKNKSIGAEAAFKLIGEASQILSDRTKRMLHDVNRARTSHVASAGQNTSYRNGQSQRVNQKTASKVSDQHFSTHSQATRQPAPPPPLPAFWTACSSCQMRYQYLRTYENQYLLCPHCRRPFIAKELISNVQANNATYGWPPRAEFQHGQFNSSNTFGGGFGSFDGFTSGSQPGLFQNYSGYASKFSRNEPGADGKLAPDYFKSYSDAGTKEKADAEKGLPRKKDLGKQMETERSMRREENLRVQKQTEEDLTRDEKKQQKRSTTVEENKSTAKKEQTGRFYRNEKKRWRKQSSSSSSESEEEDDETWDTLNDEQAEQGNDNPKACPRRSSRSKRNVTYKVDDSDDDFQETPPSKQAKVGGDRSEQTDSENVDMTKKLADLAKNAIRMKLNLPMGKSSGVSSGQGVKGKKQDGPAEEDGPSGKRANSTAFTDSKINTTLKSGGSGKASSTFKSAEKEVKEPEGHGFDQGTSVDSFSVPDADFHDFDKGREERDIEAGQIWALYDDKDGMPRYYIKVKQVSNNPFKVTVVWLELLKPSKEHRELLDLGFSFTCGEFRSSTSQVMDSVNAFSHMVAWEKGTKGIFKIYPRRGDVWGLYKDWEPGQRLLKAGDAPLKCVMVVVLSDFDENSGVTVVLLSKVEGFKTVFQIANESVLQVSSQEVLRFSHYVPAHKLKGNETPLAQQDCWELDPASVPIS